MKESICRLAWLIIYLEVIMAVGVLVGWKLKNYIQREPMEVELDG